eukprot:gene4371-6184_t
MGGIVVKDDIVGAMPHVESITHDKVRRLSSSIHSNSSHQTVRRDSKFSIVADFLEKIGSPSINLDTVDPSLLQVEVITKHPIQYYRFNKKLGQGGFSVVYKASSIETNDKYAIKQIDKKKMNKSQIANLQKEMNILSQLQHEFIVRLHSIHEINDKVFMVTEYLKGGELLNAICKREFYTEGDARRLLLQITSALVYLHSHKVIHRDLKPENLILERRSIYSNVKLIDFGFAMIESNEPDTPKRLLCGTPGYIAPEVIHHHFYSAQSDIWSLGIGEYSFPDSRWCRVSSGAKDLISKILVQNPQQRLTAKQVLKHPWMRLPVNGPRGRERLSFSSIGRFISRDNNKYKNNNVSNGKLVEDGDELLQDEMDALSDVDITDNLESMRQYKALIKLNVSATVLTSVVKFKRNAKQARERRERTESDSLTIISVSSPVIISENNTTMSDDESTHHNIHNLDVQNTSNNDNNYPIKDDNNKDAIYNRLNDDDYTLSSHLNKPPNSHNLLHLISPHNNNHISTVSLHETRRFHSESDDSSSGFQSVSGPQTMQSPSQSLQSINELSSLLIMGDKNKNNINNKNDDERQLVKLNNMIENRHRSDSGNDLNENYDPSKNADPTAMKRKGSASTSIDRTFSNTTLGISNTLIDDILRRKEEFHTSNQSSESNVNNISQEVRRESGSSSPSSAITGSYWNNLGPMIARQNTSLSQNSQSQNKKELLILDGEH